MFFEKKCQMFIPQSIGCDILKINYLGDDDINICNYVVDYLQHYPLPIFNHGKRIPLNDFIEMSLEQIKILGEEPHSKITDLVPSIPICSNQHYHNFKTSITYSISPIDGHVITDSAKISQYDIPSILYDSDITFISHEHCHSLKDTNYDEYINIYVLGETIPIFFELIANETNDSIKRIILQTRMHYLFYSKKDFLSSSKIIEKHLERNTSCTRSVYNYVQSRSGCYLNSFYYALILYGMYKQTPQKILDLILRVLNHKLTTLDMLKHLNIYCDIKGEAFEKELNGIKKTLKKW